ncbi:MAG: holo-ACP synthase [Candidatus Omnitrophica bacterium]|nr:holo-ACP synthase [Candidatus Omnitrophota bacterium]
MAQSALYGTGVDIVEVERLEEALDRWGERFLKRVFTKGEIEYSRKMRFPAMHLAARFAVKEAVRKAFGDHWDNRAGWTDIEVINHASGRPDVRLRGAAEKLKVSQRIGNIVLSLSHTRRFAVASVVMERK